VEGTPLCPRLVADCLASPVHAVCSGRRPNSSGRGSRSGTEWKRTSDPPLALENRIRRERAVGSASSGTRVKRGLRVLVVDGSKGVVEMAAAVEELFADLIAAGPRATDPEARRALRREDNLQLYRQVSTFLERRPGVGDPERSAVPFACECGASGCDAGVRATLAEARHAFEHGERLVSADHLLSA
jgi:hypothetical protein